MATARDSQYRIDRGKQLVMMVVALGFDLFPILVLALALGLMVKVITEGSCSEFVKDLASDGGESSGAWVATMNPVDTARCWWGGGAASFVGLAVAPVLYMAATFFASIVTMPLFFAWFYFGAGYNMLSMHGRKIISNMLSFFSTCLFKYVPPFNLIPVPIYTLTVWRHCAISRLEDREAGGSLSGPRPQKSLLPSPYKMKAPIGMTLSGPRPQKSLLPSPFKMKGPIGMTFEIQRKLLMKPVKGVLNLARKANVSSGGGERRGTVGTTVEHAGQVTQAAGQATRVAGRATQTAGNVMKQGGRVVRKGSQTVARGGFGIMRAGAAMSTTGLGAVVGIPTMVVGAAVTAAGGAGMIAGGAMEVAGGAAKAAGVGMKTVGSAAKVTGTVVERGGQAVERVERAVPSRHDTNAGQVERGAFNPAYDAENTAPPRVLDVSRNEMRATGTSGFGGPERRPFAESGEMPDTGGQESFGPPKQTRASLNRRR